jgi:hypothetical protein
MINRSQLIHRSNNNVNVNIGKNDINSYPDDCTSYLLSITGNPNIEREVPSIRKFCAKWKKQHQRYPPINKLISFIFAEFCPLIVGKRSGVKCNILFDLTIRYLIYQCKEQGCQYDLTDWFSQHLQWETAGQIIKRDQAYWNEYLFQLPSDDKNNIIIGRQYQFQLPSFIVWKDQSDANDNEKNALHELYRILVGHLAIHKIFYVLCKNCRHINVHPYDKSEILHIILTSSYDYLYNLYTSNDIQEAVSLNANTCDIVNQQVLYNIIGTMLWSKFITDCSKDYSMRQSVYDESYTKYRNRTILCLIRCIDANTHLNVDHFSQMIQNHLS